MGSLANLSTGRDKKRRWQREIHLGEATSKDLRGDWNEKFMFRVETNMGTLKNVVKFILKPRMWGFKKMNIKSIPRNVD